MENKITKETLKKLRVDINKELEEIGKKYGINIECGSSSYGTTDFTMKLEGIIVGAKTKEEEAYETYQVIDGLPPLHTKLKLPNGIFEIIGYSTRSRKYPILVKPVNGKGLSKLTIEYCRRMAK